MKDLERFKVALLEEKARLEKDIKELGDYNMGSSDDDRHGEEKADDLTSINESSLSGDFDIISISPQGLLKFLSITLYFLCLI